jgi:uncharacterized protein YeaO (DUF488 family)
MPGPTSAAGRGPRPVSRIRLKRAYEDASPGDGVRVLVERLWPRGLSKERAAVDVWMKDVAPSAELRRWFGHDPDRWAEFRGRYRDELRGRTAELEELRRLTREGAVTFVYGARDIEHNSAVVLREAVEEKLVRGSGGAAA